ncbi:hypothetical protein GCM10010472_28720 [Pseudonocardia halophobica]|uniref:Uncharacterized protein n=1 Tax=Pseudonocardia halophobica TaxID=29401 RepID=A0A9W6NU65_9PSEU|nr:hypothetical protein GCM10017577_02710 [Pseudonocardia halophobica]
MPELAGMGGGAGGRVRSSATCASTLDQGPYTFVTADALVLKVREGGRVVNVHALLATGVNARGTDRPSGCRFLEG